MQYRILGPLEVVVDGRSLDVGPRKQRSLFALLLIHHNRIVSTDRILDALWGEDSLGKENALWVYISRLRSILAEVTADELLVTKDHGYSLEIDPSQLDSHEFEQLTTAGLATLDADPVEAAQILRRALELWRGAPLEDFAYDDFARAEIARLDALRQQCIDARVDADLKCGRGGDLVAEIEQQIEDRPYDETPIRHLMLALYRSGRQTDSLRTFERYRRRLGEDTGTEPSPELCRLEEQILVHDERLGRSAGIDAATVVINPYRGLAAFREEDAHLFFGRDNLIANLVTAVSQHSIVTVIGPSGSGKSSVVRSGLLPAVRKDALPGSGTWLVASMFPGSHPFIELEAALLRSRLDAPDTLRGHLDGGPDEILRAALRVAPSDESTVLIVVDQLEELFTICDEAMADRFLTAVVAAAQDARRRVRFVMTLRADFYGRVLTHSGFATAMGPGIVNVVPMAPEELELAASGPARAAGVRLEPALEAALIGDVLGQPGALPLFEFTLTDLFDRRIGDTLTLDAYRSMGGIEGSVGRKAEHLYDRLTPPQQEAAEQVFLRLVSIGESETRSRRRVDATELLGLDLEVADLQAVLQAFGNERLVSFDRSERTGSPTVEVAHEALLDRWQRLSEWIDAAQADVRENARLAVLAEEWIDHGRDDAYLLSPGRYRDHAERTATSTMTLARTEREYLEASRRTIADNERDDAERTAREAAAASRARRNAWGLGAVIGLTALIALVVLWVTTRPAGPMVAYVHQAGDSVINEMLESGFQSAARSLPIRFVDMPVYDGRPDLALERALNEGADLVYLPLSDSWLANEYAAKYPGTSFVLIEPPWPMREQNISGIFFDEAAGSYLAGVAAASTSSTGHIGFVGGEQNWPMMTWAAAYEDGARSIDPTIEVHLAWVREDGSAGFNDPAGGHAANMSLFEAGADVVFTAAGESGAGAIEAARAFAAEREIDVWTIGVDADEGYLADSGLAPYVLTSVIKRFDVGIEESIAAWLDGTLEGETVFGLLEGGIEISTVNDAIDPVLPALDLATKALIAGDIVPGAMSTASTLWRSEPDRQVDVVATPGACSVASSEIRHEDVVSVTLANRSTEPVWFGVGGAPAGLTSQDLRQALDDTGDLLAAADATGVVSGPMWLVAPGGAHEIRARVAESLGAVLVLCGVGEQVIGIEILPIAGG